MTSKKNDDLNIKMGTPDEELWTTQLRGWKAELEGAEKQVKVLNHLVVLANKRIAEEKEKFK